MKAKLVSVCKRTIGSSVLAIAFLAGSASAQQALTWEQAKAKFEAVNPVLKADAANVEEMKAEEITAFLRPNPQLTLLADGTQIAPHSGAWQPTKGTFEQPNFSYLHEREHKRELRLKSAQEGTEITQSQHVDLERNLLFGLRTAFVQTLQAKAVLQLAKADLDYYDKIIDISRARYKAGDLAKIDLARIELQRVQYESEIETAIVNLRTQKIALLLLLDDRTPVDQFDVTGPFDFAEQTMPLDEFRKIALDNRPDLKAALQAAEKAVVDHKLAVANGTADPTFSIDFGRNPPIPAYFGVSVNITLRIFDKNQGEKLRTEIDIRRNERLAAAARAQVFSDVDSAYVVVNSSVVLLKPYKAKYLQQAVRVRDTVAFAYQRGGATLLDFMTAENDYRGIQLNYLNLVGAYLTAAGQLNLAVGREVIQ